MTPKLRNRIGQRQEHPKHGYLGRPVPFTGPCFCAVPTARHTHIPTQVILCIARHGTYLSPLPQSSFHTGWDDLFGHTPKERERARTQDGVRWIGLTGGAHSRKGRKGMKGRAP
ncbi:hypothetical protein Ddc_16532 [Ditylenchus destructor]|nr:hypothetical protein Ddc_16532 [Ditylenchus destructor]